MTKLATNFTLKAMGGGHEDSYSFMYQPVTTTVNQRPFPSVRIVGCSCASRVVYVHRKWKLNLQHDVENVEDIKTGKVRIRRKCKKHTDDTLAYVCKECKKPLCFKCRILGCEKKGMM